MDFAERLHETEEFLYAKIPLTRAMQVRVESYDENGLVLTAPLAANHNHLGTAFGGSLAALVMLAGYASLWLELGDRAAHIVISESNLRFRRPVRGTLRAVCGRPDDSALAEFKSNFAAKGKAWIQLKVEIEADDELAVIFDGTYVAKK
ncbi:MAG: YiiD C-terminal domain-containing protein [Chthoniobacterales bacterium]